MSVRGGATVDLHAHSTASDGLVAPEALPAAAAVAGLSAIAITDHDSLNGIGAAVAAAAPLGIRVVPGVELSAHDRDEEVHILGLHVEFPTALEAALVRFRAQRAERAVTMVARLAALEIGITMDDVTREADGAAIGRPHIARALVAAGVCEDLRDAFDRFIGAGRPAFVAKPRLTVRDACVLIHGAGGLAVWAHPGAAGRRERVEMLVESGLDGVEVRHPGHSEEDGRRLLALCDHLSLVPSGGSDWHGGTNGRRTLGAMHVPTEWLTIQDERVATLRAAGVS